MSAVDIEMGIQQAQHTKHPLQLLLHGLGQGACHGIIFFNASEFVENLVRAVVSENFGGQHRFQHLGVSFDLRVETLQLVQ